MMRRFTSIVGVVTLAIAAIVLAANSALAYSPGSAVPHKPVYNATKGGYDYSCSFTGWRSDAKVVWKCYLIMRIINDLGFPEESLVQNHTGSWTPGPTSYKTPTYYKPKNVGDALYCVKAYGTSVDGGTGWKYACQ